MPSDANSTRYTYRGDRIDPFNIPPGYVFIVNADGTGHLEEKASHAGKKLLSEFTFLGLSIGTLALITTVAFGGGIAISRKSFGKDVFDRNYNHNATPEFLEASRNLAVASVCNPQESTNPSSAG